MTNAPPFHGMIPVTVQCPQCQRVWICGYRAPGSWFDTTAEKIASYPRCHVCGCAPPMIVVDTEDNNSYTPPHVESRS